MAGISLDGTGEFFTSIGDKIGGIFDKAVDQAFNFAGSYSDFFLDKQRYKAGVGLDQYAADLYGFPINPATGYPSSYIDPLTGQPRIYVTNPQQAAGEGGLSPLLIVGGAILVGLIAYKAIK